MAVNGALMESVIIESMCGGEADEEEPRRLTSLR